MIKKVPYALLKIKTLPIFIFLNMAIQVSGQKISMADGYCYIVCPDSTISAIGLNNRGQLGDSTYFNKSTPVKVKHLKSITDVSAPGSMALRKDGTVWQLTWHGEYKLHQVNITDVAVINSAGSYNSSRNFALKKDGSLWTWTNAFGTTDGKYYENPEPVMITGIPKVVSVECSSTFEVFIILCEDGSVYTWGSSDANGNNTIYPGGNCPDILQPTKVNSLSGIKAIEAGTGTAYALKYDGTVWYWGWMKYASCYPSFPERISIDNVKSIHAEQTGLYMIKNDGTTWAWGHNFSGSLGVGNVETQPNPIQLNLSGIQDITLNGYNGLSTLAMKNDGTYWGWGYNHIGQLGDSTEKRITVPKKIPNISPAVDCYAKYPNPVVLKLDTFVTMNKAVTIKCSASQLYDWHYSWHPYQEDYINTQSYQFYIESEGRTVYASLIDSVGCYHYEKFILRTACDTLVKVKDTLVLDTALLAGSRILLKASEAQSYFWYPFSTTQTNLVYVNNDIECKATLIDNNGCKRYERFNIKKICNTSPTITPNLIMDTVTYAGKRLYLPISYGRDISWNKTDGLSCTNCFSPELVVSVPYNYVANITDHDGCIIRQQINIRIANCDTIRPEKNILKLDTLIKPGTSIKLRASLAETYLWNTSNGLSCTSCKTPTASILKNTEFLVSLTDKYNCKWTEHFKISNDCDNSSLIQPPIVLDSVTFPTAVIRLAAKDAETYSWDQSTGLSCNNCQKPQLTVTLAIEYIATSTDKYNCISKEKFIIRIRNCDTIVESYNKLVLDTLITPGSSVRLKATDARKYKWSPAKGLSCDTCRNPMARIYDNTEYSVLLTDRYLCQWTERYKLTNNCDNSTLDNPVLMMDTVTYPGTKINLIPGKSKSYSWTPDQGLNCTNCSNPIASVTESIRYIATLRDSFNCVKKEQFTIQVRDCDTIQNKSPYLRMDTVLQHPMFISLTLSETFVDYKWNQSSGLSCTDCREPILKVKTSSQYMVELYDIWRCPYKEIFKFTVLETDVIIPNVFTPNNDGLNDYFYIKGLMPGSILKVYDSRNVLVYSSSNYQGDWDGRKMNSELLDEGTYWYLLVVPEVDTFKGWVYLKR